MHGFQRLDNSDNTFWLTSFLVIPLPWFCFPGGNLSWDRCEVGHVNEASSGHVDGEVVGDEEIISKNGRSDIGYVKHLHE